MILEEILQYKRQFVAARKSAVPLADLKRRVLDVPPPPAFAPAIHRGLDEDLKVIAECKKASPSKGVIREDYDPVRIAIDYAEHGAAAISVLTDEQFFQGHLDHLKAVRAELEEMPLLRKDFTIDEYQIYEARQAGAAAVLLIAGVLDRYQLTGFRDLAEDLGMAALTEVHLEREADLAAEYGARIIGVNNRNLRTFQVDLRQTERIIRLLGGPLPGFIFVSESGISRHADVQYLRQVGVDAILVGEHFMRSPKPGEALQRLMRGDEADIAAETEVRRPGEGGVRHLRDA